MARISIFATKEKSGQTPKTPIFNEYIAARHEWDERYGNLITLARNWRIVACLGCIGTLLSTCGMLWLTSRSRVVPFVVAIDSLGRPVASGVAEQASTADDRLKRATLLSWVENLRTVTPDGVAQRKAIDRVYAHIANSSQAQTFVSEYYRADQPFTRAQSETVSVEVRSVLPTSDRTFEIEWVETTRDLYGTIKGTDHWKASFSIAINAPSEEKLARVNPLGIYITQANWSKVL